MNNVSKQIRQAYYDALNGNISVDVFKEDVPKNYSNHHVLIRVESESDRSHSSGFVTHPVVITEAVGVFKSSIDPDVVDDIDNEIRQILLPDVGSRTFTVDGIQISNIKPQSSHFISEDDGSKRYYSKITRWTQRISHT
jgi:hypothetical protein